VIYPPVNVATYRWIGQENYYLSMARLEDYKRVDAIVQAFIHMPDKKLIVMSGGSQLDALRKVAANNPNISFTGWVSHSEKLRLIGNALATIYVPIDEDFGVSPVESMAAGKPVIGVREGGLLETVTHLESGYLLESAPTNCNIKDAVAFMTAKRAEEMRLNCEKQAGLFSAETFDQKIMRIVCKRGLDTEKAAGVSDAK
jgi:glycosyltransferase involved in cell wall biosynthesis